MTKEEDIILLSQIMLKQKIVTLKELMNKLQMKDASDLEELMEELNNRYNQVGLELELFELQDQQYLSLQLTSDVPEHLSPDEIGILAAFTSLIIKSKGSISEADYKNIFKERKGLADKLEEKGYIASKNSLVDLTPLGMAFISPIVDKIQEYVEEFLNM